jgi:3',5'-cyclic AMP phosphodiesterase CpdA
MTLLAHISDPHLGPLPPVRLRQLISKRAFGYFNWHSNRLHAFDETALTALTADMRAEKPDHIAVTGDLVNIGLPFEFDNALAWLHTLGAPADVTVIPGNHDAYVASAVSHFSSKWLPFANGDHPNETMAFPFVRRRGNLALIGMSTAIPTAPLMATGRVGHAQADALAVALAETGREGLCRVVLIHHPVGKGDTTHTRRLIGASRVRAAIARHGAELVLHGHNHRTSVRFLEGPDGSRVPAVGAAAAAALPHGANPGAAYNLFRIEGTAAPYRIAMTERGLTSDGGVGTRSEQLLSAG